jgi:hypothetical protein
MPQSSFVESKDQLANIAETLGRKFNLARLETRVPPLEEQTFSYVEVGVKRDPAQHGWSAHSHWTPTVKLGCDYSSRSCL